MRTCVHTYCTAATLHQVYGKDVSNVQNVWKLKFLQNASLLTTFQDMHANNSLTVGGSKHSVQENYHCIHKPYCSSEIPTTASVEWVLKLSANIHQAAPQAASMRSVGQWWNLLQMSCQRVLALGLSVAAARPILRLRTARWDWSARWTERHCGEVRSWPPGTVQITATLVQLPLP